MAVKAVLDLDDETIPAWQRQSMQRSLRSAHVRAHAREEVRHRLLHQVSKLDTVVIHVNPCDHGGVEPEAALLEERFTRDLAESVEVTLASVERRGFAERVRLGLARLLSPLL